MKSALLILTATTVLIGLLSTNGCDGAECQPQCESTYVHCLVATDESHAKQLCTEACDTGEDCGACYECLADEEPALCPATVAEASDACGGDCEGCTQICLQLTTGVSCGFH
jgi:hypothetical protein